MNRKFAMSVLGVLLSLALTTGVMAEDVYVTKYGKKYHMAGSHYLEGKDVIKMTKEEAEEKGYKPSQEYMKSTGQVEDKADPSSQKKDQ